MTIVDELTHECPCEIHIKENTFNPSTQGPYGPGYFGDCEWCDNEYYVTEDTYIMCIEEIDHINRIIREMKEQQELIDKIMSCPKAKVCVT